jgi:hypothetical protein
MDTTNAVDSTTLLLGQDGSWWDFWMLISVGAVALAGLSVLIFTAGSVIVHKREAASASAALERYELETAGKVADAKAEGIAAGRAAGDANLQASNANERASQADERSTKANERTAALEKEAALANERTAEVMKAAAWRQLDDRQKAMISAALAQRKGRVRIMWIANGPESLGLATQIDELFNREHWEVALSANTYSFNLLWDIWIPASPDPSTTALLRNAFTGAGLRITPDKLPPTSMAIGGGGADSATILIGSKRPTLGRTPD